MTNLKKTLIKGVLGLFIGCALSSFSFGIDTALLTFINLTTGYLLGYWNFKPKK